jgi:hypothetical protein
MDTAALHLDSRFPTGVVPLRGAPETKMTRRFVRALPYRQGYVVRCAPRSCEKDIIKAAQADYWAPKLMPMVNYPYTPAR